MSDELFNALKKVAIYVKKIIDEGISTGTIQPEEEVYFRWKVDKFQYTDKGITVSSAHGEYLTKPSWFMATIKLQESIKKSDEYCFALEQMTIVFGKSDKLSRGIENFVRKLIHYYLSNSKLEDADVDALIITFLRDLREEPVKYGAEVELVGVVLQPEKIVIADNIILRQPNIEDLEKGFPEYSFTSHYLPNPSAILNVEFLGRQANEIQRRVAQAAAILRLFKVGSVKYVSYRMYSDSITDYMAHGVLTSSDGYAALETYLVAEEDMQRLKNFWRRINDSIPKSFFEIGIAKADYTSIAYNRYSDALLQNGIVERRIANAIMGLEALFFKPNGEMQELAYRLRIRVCKLLSLLGYDPHEVKEKVDDAYGIRSIFTHGGHLDYKKKKKLEAKYKEIRNLLLSVLDYLRISIIVMMLVSKEKDEFIDLIDDSLIDRGKEELLTSLIFGAKELIR